jgi:hypothetical protein
MPDPPPVERWKRLGAEAATEQDPKRLLALVQEISRLLEEKSSRGSDKKIQNILPDSKDGSLR